MTVKVLYFGGARELVGRDEEDLDVRSTTVAGFVDELTQRYPALVPRLPSLRFAVNEEFAASTTPVADGDVVAVIPPVAGG